MVDFSSSSGAAPARPSPADLLGHLAERHSVGPRHLVGPAPSDEEIAWAVGLALRAPDHRGLRPWRLVQVGDDQREALAERFVQGARLRGQGDEEVARARERAFNGPALLAMVVRIHEDEPDVPPREQWASAGGALMNLLNALHLMGYGAKVLSGCSVDDPPVRDAFCGPGEQLLAWVIAGTPRAPSAPRHPADPAAVLTRWAG